MKTTGGREERPDRTGLVRRGAAATWVARRAEEDGKPPACWVGKGTGGVRCGHLACMEVYGLAMCEEHGEEAACAALEELSHHVEQETERLLNPRVESLNPDLEYSLGGAMSVLTDELREVGRRADDSVLLRAFPLDRGKVDPETLAYVEDPDARVGCSPPFDDYMMGRLLVCKLMRLAFEDGAEGLVEILETERQKLSAQAAYALALKQEAGLLQAAGPIGRVLEEMAHARGFSGLGDLAEAVNRQTGKDYTVGELADWPRTGFGHDVDAVLGFTMEERLRITQAVVDVINGPCATAEVMNSIES